MNWKKRYQRFKVGDRVMLIRNFDVARKMNPDNDWEPSHNSEVGTVVMVYDDGSFKCNDRWPIYNPISYEKVKR